MCACFKFPYRWIVNNNLEQNQDVDNIRDRIVELEEALASLQITIDNTNSDLKNEKDGNEYIFACN